MNLTSIKKATSARRMVGCDPRGTWSVMSGMQAGAALGVPRLADSDPWGDVIDWHPMQLRSHQTTDDPQTVTEQSIIAGLLRDRIRLVLENQQLRRELERERKARLAMEQDWNGEVSRTRHLEEGDVAVFGKPSSRRSAHLRIVSRRQMTPVIDHAEFAE